MNDLTKMPKNVKIWGWLVFIAGLLALLSPLLAGTFVTVLVGATMLIAGVIRIVEAFQGGGFWSGLFGLVYALAGFVIVFDPIPGLLALTLLLAIYFLVVGVSEIIAAFQIRPTQGWGFLLFSGVVSALLALMIWNQWPLSGAWAVGVLVGIQLMFSGMTMITLGSAIKAQAK